MTRPIIVLRQKSTDLRARRRAVSLADGGVRFFPPGAIHPFPVADAQVDGTDLARWCADHRGSVKEMLSKFGALLFRRFVCTEDDFGPVVQQISGRLLNYSFRSTPRTLITPGVYTSTEYPSDQSIRLHNEMSYAADWPKRIWFMCIRPADFGGATPIAASSEVLLNIPRDIASRFERSGVKYIRRYGPHLDLPWAEAFQVESKAQVEKVCRDQGLRYEWTSENELVTEVVRPAVLRHPGSGEMVWFNQAHLFHPSALAPAIRDAMRETMGDRLPRDVRYGDGTQIYDEVIHAINDAYERCASDVDWQPGDMLLLDNERVAHGRRRFTGMRRVVVAMTDSPAQDASAP